MSKVAKTIPVEIVKAKREGYDAQFVLSASSEDRVNDTIAPEAYLPYLGQKLIALWQHKSDNPFGYWENLRMKGQKLVGDLKVAGTNLGGMIKQLLDDDVPLGASIGFAPKEYTIKDDGGLHFLEIELLEVSVVSVPAHPLATRIKSILQSDSESSKRV